MVWLSHVGVGVCVERVSLPAERTMLLILSVVESVACPKSFARLEDELMSITLPPRLVSRCRGESHVGQYCDSTSRMNS